MGSSTDERFDWNSGDVVVLPTRMGIAVYFNPKGDVVVRQEDQFDQSEDDWVVMSREDACRVAHRILDMVEEADRPAYCRGSVSPGAQGPNTSASKPKDQTAAERQRRRRRKRDGHGVAAPVTHVTPANRDEPAQPDLMAAE